MAQANVTIFCMRGGKNVVSKEVFLQNYFIFAGLCKFTDKEAKMDKKAQEKAKILKGVILTSVTN